MIFQFRWWEGETTIRFLCRVKSRTEDCNFRIWLVISLWQVSQDRSILTWQERKSLSSRTYIQCHYNLFYKLRFFFLRKKRGTDHRQRPWLYQDGIWLYQVKRGCKVILNINIGAGVRAWSWDYSGFVDAFMEVKDDRYEHPSGSWNRWKWTTCYWNSREVAVTSLRRREPSEEIHHEGGQGD